jgi:hypothetical protein
LLNQFECAGCISLVLNLGYANLWGYLRNLQGYVRFQINSKLAYIGCRSY